jgi:DNA-binding SARP family transcriptional activator
MRKPRMRHGRTNGAMHVRTLGRAEVSANGTRLGPEAKVAFPLLLHLVLERDRWVSRVQLQEMLFPEQDHLHARHSLRQSVYVLRKEGFPIEGSGPAVQVPARVVVDDYSTLLTPQLEGERELTDLMGGWLAGFAPTISRPYSHWFEAKRSEIALRMRTSLLAELAVHKRNARWAQCERTCRAILTLDPLNEEATLGLAEALALTGAKVQAIKVLERYQEEMPNADLQLPAKILRRRISERLPIVDQLHHDLPIIGRAGEMTHATDILGRALAGEQAAVLLTGAAGIGKTRLLGAIQQWAVLSEARIISHECRPLDTRNP